MYNDTYNNVNTQEKMTYNFNFINFIIGFLVGMILMLIIIWISYYTRTFLFTYCATQAPACGFNDYFIDPGNALAYAEVAGLTNTINPSTIFEIKPVSDGEKMYYDVVSKDHSNCVANQYERYIPFPQYCEFFDATTNISLGPYKRSLLNVYKSTSLESQSPNIPALANCEPTSSNYTGKILQKWDPTDN
jgi:hypothetical protein